jgi:hypothetical protein
MISLKPGIYYVGDPCYAFPDSGKSHNLWIELLESCDFFVKPEAKKDGYEVYAVHTPDGDGVYRSNTDKAFRVVSGLIGVIPMDTINKLNSDLNLLAFVGCVQMFDKPFSVKLEKDSNISIGSIKIFTGYD